MEMVFEIQEDKVLKSKQVEDLTKVLFGRCRQKDQNTKLPTNIDEATIMQAVFENDEVSRK